MNNFNDLARFGFELINTSVKNTTKFAKGFNSSLQELALNQVPHEATFENLVEEDLLNSLNKEVV